LIFFSIFSSWALERVKLIIESLALWFGQILWKEEDLSIHLRGLPLREKKTMRLHLQQNKTEDDQHITGQLSHDHRKKERWRTAPKVIGDQKSEAVQQQTGGDDPQEEAGPRRVLVDGGQILVIGLLEILPAVGDGLQKFLVGLLILTKHPQSNLLVPPKEKVPLQEVFPLGEERVVLPDAPEKGEPQGDEKNQGNPFVKKVCPH
jgi:hypothetical protein